MPCPAGPGFGRATRLYCGDCGVGLGRSTGRGLTRSGLTRSGLTRSGLTRSGLTRSICGRIRTHTPRLSVVPEGHTQRSSTRTLPPLHRSSAGVGRTRTHRPRFSIVPEGQTQRLSTSTLPPVHCGGTGLTKGRSGVTGTQARRRASGR